MPDEKVTKLADDTYEQIREKAEREGITMAEAAKRLIEQGGKPPTTCELSQFRNVLEEHGLILPKHPDWLWSVSDVIPAEMLAGTKLQPYAQARREAELRCSLGDELFDKLIEEKGTVEAIEKAITEQSEPEPISATITPPPEADAGGETEAESSPPAEAEPAEVSESEVIG